jgi:parallel beta-helix repeat protein
MPLLFPLQLQAIPLSSSSSFHVPSPPKTSLNATYPALSYSPHEPIEITNDTTLASVANSGTGTEIDPVIIEGWNITDSTSFKGISIQGTTKFFIIRNCWINGTSINARSNILIKDAQVGTVTIDNNVCLYSKTGIEIFNSSKVIITNNLCTDHSYDGIHIYLSNHSMIINNTCSFSDYGLYCDTSHFLTVSNNTFVNSKRGIELYFSSHSIFSNNLCKNNRFGIRIYSPSINYYSSNVTFVNNSCNNNEIGLQIGGHCKSVTVLNNSFNINTEEGITVVGYSDDEVNDCLIAWNELIGNGEYGFSYEIQGTNIIHHNSFLDNNGGKKQAYDDSKTNIWYDQETEEGNWWGDYLGRGEYQLDGSSKASDPFPFFIDNDGDFMADPWEDKVGLNSSLDDSSEDPDGDLLLNIDEFFYNTDPFNPDTDGDGYSDYDEIMDDTDPLNKLSNAKMDRIAFIILIIIYLVIIILVVILTVFYRSRKKRIDEVKKGLKEIVAQLVLWEGKVDIVKTQSEKTNLTEKQKIVINSNFSVLEMELKSYLKKYEEISSYMEQKRIVNHFATKEKKLVDDLIWQCLAKSGNKAVLLKDK